MKFKFIDSKGIEGFCDIERYASLIIATELAGNPAMTVSHACTEIATQFCAQYGIRPWDLYFMERYDGRSNEVHEGDKAIYAAVRMFVDKDGTFHSPEWTGLEKRTFEAVVENYRSKATLEALYDDQMEKPGICPRCGKGKAGVGTALSRRARVMVCNDCGMSEAMMDAAGEQPMLFSDWELIKVRKMIPPPAAEETEGDDEN